MEEAKELPTIEQHAQDAGLETWVLPGAMRRNGWAQQQRVTRQDFDAGAHRFLHGGTAGEPPYTPDAEESAEHAPSSTASAVVTTTVPAAPVAPVASSEEHKEDTPKQEAPKDTRAPKRGGSQ